MPNVTKVTKKVEQEFLSHITNGKSVIAACRAVGVSRMSIYRLANRKTSFARALDAAREDARLAKVEALEAAADQRAVDGVLDPVYYKGKVCGARRRFSDSLLITRLKAEDPERYRDKRAGDDRPDLTSIQINIREKY